MASQSHHQERRCVRTKWLVAAMKAPGASHKCAVKATGLPSGPVSRAGLSSGSRLQLQMDSYILAHATVPISTCGLSRWVGRGRHSRDEVERSSFPTVCWRGEEQGQGQESVPCGKGKGLGKRDTLY
eukprot:352199-Chlamydomonas_euryale.AAC.16